MEALGPRRLPAGHPRAYIGVMSRLNPEILMRAYASGIFPMAESRGDDDLFWVDPERRGIIPLDRFHVPRRLRRTVRRHPFEIRIDSAFEAVMRRCAEAARDRTDSWINEEIVRAFIELHRLGHAHSIETWRDGDLVGGLYGAALGGAFFGESMFARASDASKVALVHLVARLRQGGYRLLDAQFLTRHLEQFGAEEIARERYHQMLAQALTAKTDFYCEVGEEALEAVLQSSTQTS